MIINTVSILIPVYNEVNVLELILSKVNQAGFAGLKKEIIIIDDGSFDGTVELLNKINGNSDLKIYYHGKNQGKGAAIRTAMKYVTGQIVVIQDADLEYNPDEYDKIIDQIIKNNADVVYGSRLLRSSQKRSFKFLSRLFNKFITMLANILYGKKLTDIETCYKAFKRNVINAIEIESDGFNFDPEVTAKVLKKGYDILEVPISYTARGYKEGKKITWKDAFKAVYTLIKYSFYQHKKILEQS